jgi:hypothetical protein
MMEFLGLFFLDRKVTKVVTNTASIRCLARRSGITLDAALRLLPFKTKAQAHQALRNLRRARSSSTKKSSDRCKRSKGGWHAKLLKRQHLFLQQDSATRAGRGVFLWPILLGHNNSDPFPNSPLFPRDMSRDSPQMECNRAHSTSSSVAGDNSPGGSSAEGGPSSSAQEDNSPHGAQASSVSSSARGDNTLFLACTEDAASFSSSVQGDNSTLSSVQGDDRHPSLQGGGMAGDSARLFKFGGQAGVTSSVRGGIRVHKEGRLRVLKG